MWYLLDNEDGPPERALAKTIVALSPRKGTNAFPRFHKFLKDVNRSGKLCMPLWSFEEISDCREGIFSDLSEDVVSELFDKAGGVPRSILLKPSREKEPKTAVEAGLEDIEDALRHVRDPAKIYLCFMEEKETIQFSSQLMHLVPGSWDYLFANSRRRWASRYVLAKFSKSLGNQSIGYLKSSIASRHTLNPQGFQFECLVVGMFQSLKSAYNYRLIDDVLTEELLIQLPTRSMTFKELEELFFFYKNSLRTCGPIRGIWYAGANRSGFKGVGPIPRRK